MSARHPVLAGKVQVFKRDGSPHWQCSASVGGRQYRVTTKEEGLAEAKSFAEDWYLTLKGKHRFGGGIEPKRRTGKTFKDAGEQFLKEVTALTFGERSPQYLEGHERRLNVHLYPFLGEKLLTEITPGAVQDYRVHRMTSRKRVTKEGEELILRPARSTLHHEIVTLRLVLKTAHRHGWLPMLPDLSTPYKTSGKIVHRAWFSPAEYKMLYEATRERAANPRHNRGRWRAECEQLHDFVIFMVNTGLRPDEALRLQFRDVEIVEDDDSGDTILEIEVRGKRGVGFCKSMPGAVHALRRLAARNTPEGEDAPDPMATLFWGSQRELLNKILEELNLKRDRDGQVRTAYSLRHTYISMRLMEGADIYQVAKNCRTSVEMIEKFYASHIKNMIDASAINVRRQKPKKKTKPKSGVAANESASRSLARA
jgi:integrase